MTIHIGKHNIRFLYADKNSYFSPEYQNKYLQRTNSFPKTLNVKLIENIKYCYIFAILFNQWLL